MRKPKIFKILNPIYYSAQAIGTVIFVPGDFDSKRVDILEHELFHLKRQKEIGVLKWIIKYLINSKFRYMEELLAYRHQIGFLRNKGEKINYDHYASLLSSKIYFMNKKYEDIIIDLKNESD